MKPPKSDKGFSVSLQVRHRLLPWLPEIQPRQFTHGECQLLHLVKGEEVVDPFSIY